MGNPGVQINAQQTSPTQIEMHNGHEGVEEDAERNEQKDVHEAEESSSEKERTPRRRRPTRKREQREAKTRETSRTQRTRSQKLREGSHDIATEGKQQERKEETKRRKPPYGIQSPIEGTSGKRPSGAAEGDSGVFLIIPESEEMQSFGKK